MNPELEKLYAKKEDAEKKLTQARHRIQRLENRQCYLLDGTRQARAHRLITRGAAVESILPNVRSMSEREFYQLMETVLTLPEVQAALAVYFPKTEGNP